MVGLHFGPQLCTDLAAAARREWLVADGCGGYAMGTVAGLRTRRYHGLLVVSLGPPGRRQLALAALDPVVGSGGGEVRLAVHEWAGAVVDPRGHELLTSFALEDGVPRWRWSVGGVVLERQLAVARGRPAVGVLHRLVAAPGPVRLTLAALCSWRDAHGERHAGAPLRQEAVDGGFVLEGAYRVRGPGFEPGGVWYRDVRYREEAGRGLPDGEDLWCAGTFGAELAPGEVLSVEAWAGDLAEAPPPGEQLVDSARRRARVVAARSRPADATDATLALAADQLILEGPTVVAGYPWFGEWSRDTLTAYEGLFLETGRADEGRLLLERELSLLSEGMLPNTSDGPGGDNTIDATLWLAHAVGRHVEATGDDELCAVAVPALEQVVERHLSGTRHGIAVDPADGLLAGGEEGIALTWMDARVEGRPVTRRAGKPVEVNALFVDALSCLAALERRAGRPDARSAALAGRARASFLARFVAVGPEGATVADVVDGDPAESAALRPNQLLACSLPAGPLRGRPEAAAVVATVRSQLLTPLGLRSLSPADPAYRGRHRGGPAARDGAYHQGTVWPWLVGAYVEASLAAGLPVAGVLDGLVEHLGEWGLGSVSETADGDPPHQASGCPFQAWSVAELLRAKRLVARSGVPG